MVAAPARRPWAGAGGRSGAARRRREVPVGVAASMGGSFWAGLWLPGRPKHGFGWTLGTSAHRAFECLYTGAPSARLQPQQSGRLPIFSLRNPDEKRTRALFLETGHHRPNSTHTQLLFNLKTLSFPLSPEVGLNSRLFTGQPRQERAFLEVETRKGVASTAKNFHFLNLRTGVDPYFLDPQSSEIKRAAHLTPPTCCGSALSDQESRRGLVLVGTWGFNGRC